MGLGFNSGTVLEVLGVLRQGGGGGGVTLKWFSQSRPHFKLKGLLCVNHHQTAPPGGLAGITAQDVAPLSGFPCNIMPQGRVPRGRKEMKCYGLPLQVARNLCERRWNFETVTEMFCGALPLTSELKDQNRKQKLIYKSFSPALCGTSHLII